MICNQTLKNKQIQKIQLSKNRPFFERKWLIRQEAKDSYAILKAMEDQKIQDILTQHTSPQEKKLIHLPCGQGELSCQLKKLGFHITGLDIANNALKICRKKDPNITWIQDTLPHTQLEDQSYEIALCTDLLGLFSEDDQRLTLSEIQRILTQKSLAIFSNRLDYTSNNPQKAFEALICTEFTIIAKSLSYYRLNLNLIQLMQLPQKIKEKIKKKYNKNKTEKRFLKNKFTIFFIRLLEYLENLLYPLQKSLKENEKLNRWLEGLSKGIWRENACSHIILLGKKKQIFAKEKSEGFRKGEETIDLYEALYGKS